MLKILLFCFTISAAYAAEIQSILLSNINDDIINVIRQQWSANVSQCVIDQIRQITIDYAAGDQWMLIIDQSQPFVTIQRIDGQQSVICDTTGVRHFGTDPNGQKYENLDPYISSKYN